MMKTLSAVFLCCSLLFAAPSYGAGMDDAERIEKADALIKAKKYEEGRTLIEPLAMQSDPKAENLMGLYHYYNKRLQESCDWFEKSANQGLARGQYNFALCFAFGEGRDKDTAEANYWYEKAAKGGNKYAQMNYGNAFIFGKGIEKNIEKGRYWLNLSANQGHLGAMFKLAETYRDVDNKYFLDLHRKSAQSGNMHSMFILMMDGTSHDKKYARTFITDEVRACIYKEAKFGDIYSNFCKNIK